MFLVLYHKKSVKSDIAKSQLMWLFFCGLQGCQENHDKFITNFAAWSAFHSDDYGYTRMTIHNTTHLYMEQVSDDQVHRLSGSFFP